MTRHESVMRGDSAAFGYLSRIGNLARCAAGFWGGIIGAGVLLASVSVAIAEQKSPTEKDEPQPSTSDKATNEERKPSKKASGDKATAELLAEDTIRKALKQTAKLSASDDSLTSVLEWLSSEYKIPITIDRPALEEAGIEPDTPVTVELSGITLRSVLRLMLRELQLTHTIRNEHLIITTPEKAEQMLATRVYPVTDLVPLTPSGFGDQDETLDYDYDELIDLIRSTIEPTTWDDVGGPGSVIEFRGNLVISQTDAVHEQLANLLASLRMLPSFDSEAAARGKAPRPKVLTAAFKNWSDESLVKALEKKSALELDETPLSEALQGLSEKHHIPMVIDADALDEAGISPDTPVTIHCKNLTLRSTLRLMLDELQLTFMLRDEVMLITTPEMSETELKTIVYNVRDLVFVGDRAADYDMLVDVIQSSIAPTSWDDVGGPGSINAFDQRGALVFSQTDEVHREVSALFAKLRRQKLVDPPAVNHDPQKIVTRVYLVEPNEMKSWKTIKDKAGKDQQRIEVVRHRPNIQPEVLHNLITTQVDPGTWTPGETSLRVIPGRVLVTHRRETQGKVQQFLKKLGLTIGGNTRSRGFMSGSVSPNRVAPFQRSR